MEKYFFEKHGTLKASIVKEINFPCHLHSEIEIIGIKDGCGKAFLNGEEFYLKENDFFTALPDQLHKYSDFKTGKYYLIIIPQYLAKSFFGHFKSADLKSPVINDAGHEISSILDLFIENRSGCNDKSIQSYLSLVLSRIIDLSGEKLIKENNSSIIKIINYCRDNFESDISIDKIAEEFALSSGYISHIFSKKLKINFRTFINGLRIEKAKELIEAGNMSITDIGFAVGFSNSRTFNRAFYLQTHKTPREYKNNDCVF